MKVLTDATIFAVESTIQAREVTFSDTHNASSMVAIFAGSSTSLEAQNCSFVGWIGSNVVRVVCCDSLCSFLCFLISRCTLQLHDNYSIVLFKG